MKIRKQKFDHPRNFHRIYKKKKKIAITYKKILEETSRNIFQHFHLNIHQNCLGNSLEFLKKHTEFFKIL